MPWDTWIIARARVAAKDLEDICAQALDFLGEELEYADTFKVEAKRADKSFPMKSPRAEEKSVVGEKLVPERPLIFMGRAA